jgi:hypothetical protein
MTEWNPVWHPRLRAITSDAEWRLIERGLCPTGGPTNRCLQPIDPNARYAQCTAHDQQARALDADYFGG